ncbi:NAD(P)H-dependent oxidoreductase [Luteimonas sp. SX5]|uniref:FMN dependent NADH:quinone oxidoreductase n=1 Tax=Luteimonas galliterrae TaxID=2940486 RepID=A0ABT0MFA9_9GAMM|nr:NAD(P)H-dependent oxidoreductase [Luteimonas galliterrae]MCL1633551.1 NAD(P)H-dependent oxidoreductase [Luteimonas galliterrae]
MKLLHLDSSALGADSVTRELSAAIVARWQDAVPGLTVEYLDLDANPLPHLTSRTLARADVICNEKEDQLLAQFLAADVVVVGAPMYNFAIPSTLKAWIDRITVRGKTFRYTGNGPEGLAGGKHVIIATGRGSVHGDNAPSDFQEPYLRFLFGFIGIKDVEFVRAEGVGLSPQHRAEALAKAHAAIPGPLPKAA